MVSTYLLSVRVMQRSGSYVEKVLVPVPVPVPDLDFINDKKLVQNLAFLNARNSIVSQKVGLQFLVV